MTGARKHVDRALKYSLIALKMLEQQRYERSLLSIKLTLHYMQLTEEDDEYLEKVYRQTAGNLELLRQAMNADLNRREEEQRRESKLKKTIDKFVLKWYRLARHIRIR